MLSANLKKARSIINIADVNTRRKKILQAVIKAYITTASPVSSETVYKLVNLGVSPATIRNDMVELEQENMILQRHISSGRVPTEKGFRYYVNLLMEESRLSPPEKERIKNEYKNYNNRVDIDKALERTSHILSELTNNVGMVLFPKLRADFLKRIEVVSLGGKKILSVLVTSMGLSRSVILNLKEDVKEAQLLTISRFLNTELESVRLDELEDRLVARLLNESDSFYHLLKVALEIIHKSLGGEGNIRLCVEGRDRAVKQPEFKDLQVIRLFLHTLEDKSVLIELLQQDMEGDGINIHIGEEDLSEHMKDFSVITKAYKLQNKIVGILGVVGPVRMEYATVITTVDYIADLISNFLGIPE